MEKKDLKFYEAPAVEAVELEVKSSILSGSPAGGGSQDIPAENIDPGFFE